jgi:hypothetical protein
MCFELLALVDFQAYYGMYKVFIGKPVGMRLHGIPGNRGEDNIRMDLREVRWKGEDWMHQALDRDQ